ncbi:MAG: Fic family protein [Actinomycetia bacterium]|nr:Fic family protein [Actinomycetes bacterium]
MDKTSIILTSDVPSATLTRRVRAGELVRLAQGVYTSAVDDDPAAVVRREWPTIAGRLYPGAVITDRSAPVGGPVNGVLYLAHDARARETALPGLLIRARSGAGPQPGDIELPGGLHQAGKARALAENARPTRARDGQLSAGLTDTELADWIDRICRLDGEERLYEYRARAEALGEVTGTSPAALARLSKLIGTALGTQRADSGSAALNSRRAGLPYDSDRLDRFGVLITALGEALPQNRPADEAQARYRHMPFFESYFSNYIEGTEFEISEAIALVYEGQPPGRRTQDAHDLIGTWRVVSDHNDLARRPRTPTEYVDTLRRRHAEVMAGRPDKNPGVFKEKANQAGNTTFVLPGLVEGTLRAAFDRIAELDTAWERAVYAMFAVSEVHPFDDGNGRIARVMMNAELVSGGQTRIIIPTVFRDDYIGALRRLTRHADPSVLIKVLRIGQDFTALVDFAELTTAVRQLQAADAFEPAGATHQRNLAALRAARPSIIDTYPDADSEGSRS